MSEAFVHEPEDHGVSEGSEGPDGSDGEQRGHALVLAPTSVEVRRNAGLAAAVGGVASALAIAYLARAFASGSPLDWVLAGGLGVLGVGYLAALVDARTPLLVADTQGVRMRLGRDWRGLPWGALGRVEHTPRRGLLRDGRLVMVVRHPARFLEELDRSARRQSRWSQRLYGAPFAVPLGVSTRVTGAGEDLTAALAELAAGRSLVVDVLPALAEEPEESAADEVAQPEIAQPKFAQPEIARPEPRVSATPSPLREPAPAVRAEIRREEPAEDRSEDEPEGRELRRPGSVSLVEDTVVWGERVSPSGREGRPVEPLLIAEPAIEPAVVPVIGPELAAARTRLGLTVDQLAERTRIRPHVIESIEVDDFVPCGGDFYARGHLRTLARVLGIDVVPLLEGYDECYADAPINPRRVFEAELATGAHGPIRGTRGGPNWSVLVAAVMALVLVWSVARLLTDGPAEVRDVPLLNGSAGLASGPGSAGGPGRAAAAVPVSLTAAGGGARVRVRDASGAVVFDGTLAFGETKKFEVSPPVRVQSTDGSVTVTVDGEDHGALGATGRSAQDMFTVPR